jgi:hypothetical protein
VTIQKSWFDVKTEHKLAASDIAGFSVQQGMTAGHSAFYDLKVLTRNGGEITAAKNLGVKPEADWLVQQMTAALKNTPAANPSV